MSSENKYLNDQYKGFFEDSLSKTDPELFKAISDVEILNNTIINANEKFIFEYF